MSGLGKGITISSIGVLLKAHGVSVTVVKIDPYLVSPSSVLLCFLARSVCVVSDVSRDPGCTRTPNGAQNLDAGTLRPLEHGECFVTADGGETDLDIGELLAACRVP